jgi:hypothetical protein
MIDRTARLEGIGTARAAPGPPSVSRFVGNKFIAADGVALPVRKWLPSAETRAAVLALHGFDDYSHAFAEPSKTWAKDGIATERCGRFSAKPAAMASLGSVCGTLWLSAAPYGYHYIRKTNETQPKSCGWV